MNLKPPAARPLPHRQEILERVLADDRTPVRRRRRAWLIPVSAAASIALVAGGVLFATGHDKTRPSPATRTSPSTPADIHITLGRLTEAEKSDAADDCINPRPGRPGRTTIRYRAAAIDYGMKVRTWSEGSPGFAIAVTTTPRDLTYACSGGDDRMAGTLVAGPPLDKAYLQPPDAAHPAVPLTTHRFLPIDFDKQPDLLTSESWYRVDARVASLRERWIVRGKPGPWYVADAVDGLVFVRSWDSSAALKPGEQVRIETQVLDHQGRLLDAPAGRKPGGNLKPSPGTTQVLKGKVVREPADATIGTINFR
jgi:hypothetical protein